MGDLHDVRVDAHFAHPRLAALYDVLDPDRSDLEVYVDLVDELGGHSVLDVGCGAGTFALMLIGHGCEVVAVDPAAASLDVARAKPAPTLCGGSTATPGRCCRCASTLPR